MDVSNLTHKKTRKGVSYFVDDTGETIIKECSKCGEVKESLFFYATKKHADGLFPICKECSQRAGKIKRERNPDYNRDYYHANKEYMQAMVKVWREKNRDVSRLHDSRRRARIADLPDDLTAEQVSKILERFGGCALTGTSEKVEMDHVLPLSKADAGTTYTNMIPLCRSLNASKWNKNIFEWFKEAEDRFALDRRKFDEVISYLAEINEMSVEEYKAYYYSEYGRGEKN